VIAVDLDNVPAATLGDGAQIALLTGGGLLVGRDAKVEGGAAHGDPFVAQSSGRSERSAMASAEAIRNTRRLQVSGRLKGLKMAQ